MTVASILEIIDGLLKFPNEILALVKMLKGTASEADAAIVAKAQSDWDTLQKTGRPTWD